MKLLSVAALAAFSLIAADIPRPAPKTVFPAPNGATIDASKYAGKVVALEFLLTTCPHCQKTAAILQRMQEEYGARGFQALGVATNTEVPAVVEDFRRQFGIKFPVGFTPREAAHAYLQHPVMQTMYMPQLVFIDKKGTIRAQYPGGHNFYDDMRQVQNMRDQIEALLKESGMTSAPKPAPKPAAKAPVKAPVANTASVKK